MRITISTVIDTGLTLTKNECGACPFRVFDWNHGDPKGDELCTNPGFTSNDVTGGMRHHQCIEAEESANKMARIAEIFNAWANGDEPEGSPSSRRAMEAIGDLLGHPF